jgi:hypothetical protein
MCLSGAHTIFMVQCKHHTLLSTHHHKPAAVHISAAAAIQKYFPSAQHSTYSHIITTSTLHSGTRGQVLQVLRVGPQQQWQSIQAAVDAAAPGATIIIDQGK